MGTPDAPRVKLLELPLLELGGSTIDVAPLLFLTVLFLIALYGLLYGRRRSQWRLTTQTISLLLFVFAAHQTMCVLRSWVFGFQAIGRNDTIAFALLHIAVALIFMALIAGSIFCGWICPVGTIQEWLGGLSRWLKGSLSSRAHVVFDVCLSLTALLAMAWLAWRYAPSNFFFSENVSILFTFIGLLALPLVIAAPLLDKRARWFRYVSLIGRMVIILIGIHTTNPGCTIYETEVDYSAAISFLGVILATLVLSRAYCRYICPFGAVFALLSRFALFKVSSRRSPCATNCLNCQQTCPVGALDKGQLDEKACVSCGRCLDRCGTTVSLNLGEGS